METEPPGPPDDKKSRQERIAFAALRYGKETFLGKDHRETSIKMQAFLEAQDPDLRKETGGDPDKFIDILLNDRERFPYIHGFLSTRGKFYDPKRAVRIAEKAAQLKKPLEYGEVLISENVEMDGSNA